MEIKPGQVVYSKAGRDKGECFIVLVTEGTQYVYIADGDLRKVDHPKKKKLKHLAVTDIIVDSLSQKLYNNLRVNNSEIRKALELFRENTGEHLAE